MSSSFRRSGRPAQNVFSSSSSPSISGITRHGDRDPPPSVYPNNMSSERSSPLSSPPATATVLERIGTKPWIGGLTLTSTGLRELDAIVGGGQPLGTVILAEEDRWTQDLALCLVRYWSAEALAQGQTLSLVSTLQDVDELDLNALDHTSIQPNIQGMSRLGLLSFLSMLPRDLHLDKSREKTRILERRLEDASSSSSLAGGGTLSSLLDVGGAIQEVDDDNFDPEDDDEDEEDIGAMGDANVSKVDKDEGLVNAWQYKVSVQRERMGDFMSFGKSGISSSTSSRSTSSGNDKIFCHSYDLGGKMMDQLDDNWLNLKDNPHLDFIDCSCANCPPLCCTESKTCAVAFFQSCLLRIQEKIAQHPKTVIRLLLLNAPVKKVSLALPLLLSYIRQHCLPVVLFVTVRPWQQPAIPKNWNAHNHHTTMSHTQALISLRRVCDAVFCCEGFSAMSTPPPLEFSDLAGILSIRKIALQALSHFSDTSTSRRPPANRYGMKRDRRKMTIRMLHLPPEDFSAGGGSVGSGARSGGGKLKEDPGGSGSGGNPSLTSRNTALVPGLGCASHTRSSHQSLDF